MKAFILGTKTKQTQFFDEQKMRRNMTVVSVSSCYVTQLKTPEHDGYFACQIGLQMGSSFKNITKPIQGKTKKAGIKTPLNFFKELRFSKKDLPELVKEDNKKGIKVGEKVFYLGMKLTPLEVFQSGDTVTVTGITKGKGFQGVVKRHGFAGGPKTHGQSDRLRAPGSIGSGTTPGRVYKGKPMAGRMGGTTVTIKGLKVVEATEETLKLQGLAPGGIRSVLLVKKQ